MHKKIFNHIINFYIDKRNFSVYIVFILVAQVIFQ
nr:MAG TPA: hypothetical protein [Caudoviricetes sp.]